MVARRALGYRSLEAPGNRRRRQMVTVPQGIQNPAYSPPSTHNPDSEYEKSPNPEAGALQDAGSNARPGESRVSKLASCLMCLSLAQAAGRESQLHVL